MKEVIESMHASFLKHSGLDCKLALHEGTWSALAGAGYTLEDVEIFLQWVLWENAGREREYHRVFHIPNMFRDLGFFDADLALAKAWHRNRREPPTPREEAMEQLRPTVEPELVKARLNPPRSAGEVLEKIFGSVEYETCPRCRGNRTIEVLGNGGDFETWPCPDCRPED